MQICNIRHSLHWAYAEKSHGLKFERCINAVRQADKACELLPSRAGGSGCFWCAVSAVFHIVRTARVARLRIF